MTTGNIGIRNLAGIGVGDIDVYGTNSQQKKLTIEFKSHKIDKEKHILVFEVSAPVLKNTKATIFVEEIDKYINDPVLTDKQSIKSNGATIVTTSFNKNMNFTESFFDDGNTFQATITCDGFSAVSPIFSLINSKKKEEEKNVEKCLCKKTTLSADDLRYIVTELRKKDRILKQAQYEPKSSGKWAGNPIYI